MDAFRELRQQAAAKRDHSIAYARQIYRKDIKSIEALERRIPPLPAKIDPTASLEKEPNTAQLIRQLIPKDQPFTVADVMTWLHDAKGGKFHEPTVRTYVSRMCSQGFIKRLHRTGQKYTLWVATESLSKEGMIETRTLAQVTEEVLKERGPSTVAEIVISMREKNYRADNQPQCLMRAARDMFKRYRGRFVRGKDGRWAVAVGHC